TPIAPSDAERRTEEIEVLADAHIVIRPELIGHVTDQVLNSAGMSDAIDARNLCRTAGRTNQSDEDLDGSRLAGTVGSDEPQNLAGGDCQAQVFQGRHFAVALRQSLNNDDRILAHEDTCGWRKSGSLSGQRRTGRKVSERTGRLRLNVIDRPRQPATRLAA